MRGIVMMPLDELRKRDPKFDVIVARASVDPNAAQAFYSMLVQLKGGDGKPVPYMRMSTVYSCETCKHEFEKALAKAPSWAVVEINRGPGPDKIISTS